MSILLWLCAIICATIIGEKKHRGLFGFLMGFLFSWIGVLIIYCVSNNGKTCKFCGGTLNDGYSVCPHCGKDNK